MDLTLQKKCGIIYVLVKYKQINIMKIEFKTKFLVKEAQFSTLDSEDKIESAESSDSKVTASSLKLLYQRIANFGKDIMEKDIAQENLSVVQDIENAELSYSSGDIKAARTRFEKMFQESQELVLRQ
jgi:hypothetical protein